MMKNKKIKVYYMPAMAYQGAENSFSQSPQKPKLFVEHLQQISDWEKYFDEKRGTDGILTPALLLLLNKASAYLIIFFKRHVLTYPMRYFTQLQIKSDRR